MSAQYRPATARRLNSGAWSRLRPSAAESLENVGLPSKGETRLNDYKAQESYYDKITEKWLEFCAKTGSPNDLEKQFAALATTNAEERTGPVREQQSVPTPSSQKSSMQPLTTTTLANGHSPELAVVLMAMRKLREAIVATSRIDDFARKAYIFIIRQTILFQHWESYHVALLYLLTKIHVRTPLSALELQEFVGYYILDLACRQRDFHAVYRVCREYSFRDRQVDRIVNALVHDDFVVFWSVRAKVEGYVRALMGWAEDMMRLHALKCLARGYFTAEKEYIERSTNMEWEVLVKTQQVGWELDGEKVTIRRAKSK